MSNRLRLVQLEIAGPAPVDPGRYLVAEPRFVVVVSTPGRPVARPPRKRRLRRERVGEATPLDGSPPSTRLTAVDPDPLDAERAAAWLERLRAERERADELVEDAARLINRVLGAHREATLDPSLSPAWPRRALAVRIGYANPEQAADGEWEQAIELPHDEGAATSRREALKPRERVADLLAGRAAPEPEALAALRAREDVEAGLAREAAAELGLALEFIGPASGDEELDTAAPDALALAAQARAGDPPLPDDALARIEACLRLVERLLRRRRARR